MSKRARLHESPGRRRWRDALVVTALAVFGIAAFGTSLASPLVLDDYATIVINERIRDWRRPDLFLFPERESPVAGRPVVSVTLALNYALGGTSPRGYRAFNLAAHVLCAIIGFFLLQEILSLPSILEPIRGRATSLACVTSLIWLLHPVNSEVVNYLTQRTESLMACFYLLTLYASVKALGSSKARAWQTAAIAACALGMGCKESMVTAPVAVVLFDRIFVFRSFREAVARRGGFYFGLAASWLLLVALLLTGPRVHSAGFSAGVSPWTYLTNQAVMITHYLRLAVWPRNLVVNYGWPVPLRLAEVWPQALVVCGALAAVVIALVRAPRVGFLGAWFFLALAPTSSVVPIATEVGAERRMYVPLMAIAVLVVLAATTIWDRVRLAAAPRLDRSGRWAALGATALVAMTLLTLTMRRNRDYASAVRLAETNVAGWPSSTGHHMLGVALFDAGRTDEAISELRKAIPDAPRAYYALGLALLKQGQDDEAMVSLREFIARQPLLIDVPSAHASIARIFGRRGEWPQAESEARQSVREAPSLAEGQALLALALFRQNKFAEAAGVFGTYLAMRPGDSAARTNLAVSLAQLGRLPEAIDLFRRLVETNPHDASARRNLAVALFDARRLSEATAAIDDALTLQPQEPFLLRLKGQTEAQLGHLDRARTSLERAAALNPGDPETRAYLAQIRALIGR